MVKQFPFHPPTVADLKQLGTLLGHYYGWPCYEYHGELYFVQDANEGGLFPCYEVHKKLSMATVKRRWSAGRKPTCYAIFRPN